VILVSGPESAAEALPSEAELLAVFERVRGLDLAAYEDAAPEGGLMAEPPAPGEIVERRTLPEIGVTEWRLSNGVRVVLKPTDFRRDQVMIEGFSPGGHSLASDEEHLAASHAADLVSLGGLGEHDEIALAKVLAGQVAEVGPYVDELEEGISAGGSAEDLETLFQLVHLALTAPRLDLEAVRSFKDRLRPMLENRLARPEQVFVEEMFRVLTLDHPRRQPLTAERLDEVDPELALEAYRERFADLGDATFLVVGSFEPSAIEGLVRTYLGSLPAGGREESWRDVGLDRPPEPVELTVERGIEPKASVWLVLHGDAPLSGEDGEASYRRQLHDLAALAQALEIRLREVLREDLGAVYGVSVAPDLSWRPRERYSVSIQFGCAPEQARELVERVREVIHSFREDGPPAELAARVREMQTRKRETDVRENGFWLAALGGYYRRGEDPRAVLEYQELVASVTPERLRDSARRYLEWERRVLGVLLPEGGAAPAAPAPDSDGGPDE
jgi:zinc protease